MPKPKPPDPHGRPPIAGSAELGRLLFEMSLLMGLSPAGTDALAGACNLRGPADLLCRLQLGGDVEVTQVRPEVLLPIEARELSPGGVERLLLMQRALMLEIGWWLGLSSEGRLQISPLAWIDDAADAVHALDLGQALGLQAVRVLRGDDDTGEFAFTGP